MEPNPPEINVERGGTPYTTINNHGEVGDIQICVQRHVRSQVHGSYNMPTMRNRTACNQVQPTSMNLTAPMFLQGTTTRNSGQHQLGNVLPSNPISPLLRTSTVPIVRNRTTSNEAIPAIINHTIQASVDSKES